MDTQEIEQLIAAGLPNAKITITGDGSHFDALIICDEFNEKNVLERQKMVYATLGDAFTSGKIHALNMKTYTVAEWERQQG